MDDYIDCLKISESEKIKLIVIKQLEDKNNTMHKALQRIANYWIGNGLGMQAANEMRIIAQDALKGKE